MLATSKDSIACDDRFSTEKNKGSLDERINVFTSRFANTKRQVFFFEIPSEFQRKIPITNLLEHNTNKNFRDFIVYFAAIVRTFSLCLPKWWFFSTFEWWCKNSKLHRNIDCESRILITNNILNSNGGKPDILHWSIHQFRFCLPVHVEAAEFRMMFSCLPDCKGIRYYWIATRVRFVCQNHHWTSKLFVSANLYTEWHIIWSQYEQSTGRSPI